MKTSTYDEPCEEDDESMTSHESHETSLISTTYITQYIEPPPVPSRTIKPIETLAAESEKITQNVYRDIELVSPEEVVIRKVEIFSAERWSDSTASLPGQTEDVETVTSDTDPGNAQCEPVSEMYYTASSEVSLISDTEVPEKTNEETVSDPDDRRNVIAGHVAAMRERFESMTRTNTPCPDLIRSLSPSLEVFRNSSPSPDRLA